MTLNIMTLANLLDEHELSKIFGANRIVHTFNEIVSSEKSHINGSMTGKQISKILKCLPVVELNELLETKFYDQSEYDIILNQIDVLNSFEEPKADDSKQFMEYLVALLSTVFAISIILATIGYHLNSIQSDVHIKSNVLTSLDWLFNFAGFEDNSFRLINPDSHKVNNDHSE